MTTHRNGELPKPIPGSKETAGAAVSSDVHLYGDPLSLDNQNPMLFADCEGLTGGAPEAERHRDESWLRFAKR
jgi:hypothetical protein